MITTFVSPITQPNVLGGQVTVGAGQVVQVAHFSSPDLSTLPLAITLAPLVPLPPALPPQRPYAIINFGNSVCTSRVEVDISRGCQFSLSASTVNVQLASEPNVAPTSAKLAAMISFATPSCDCAITRTLNYVVEDAVVGPAIAIPTFAKSMLPFRTSNPISPGFDITINVLDASGILIQQIQFPSNTFFTTPIMLSGFAAFVQIDNRAEIRGIDSSMTIIFELSI